MSESYYWWYVYGHFTPGEGNFPHLGEVIRYYRKMCSLEREELAGLLGCSKRYIEMLESDQNIIMPQLLPRRQVLAKTLHIPPILLGLSSLILSDENTPLFHATLAADTLADARRIVFYEEMLTLSWECYYTSSIQRAARNVDFCFEMLNDEAKEGKGVQCDQFDAIRCRFLRLSALIARENGEIDRALDHINKAVSIASRLKNAELIAASLIGRIRIHYYQQHYEQALQDAEAACFYADADLLPDPLKGKCYQMAGEAQAYLAGRDKFLQEKSIAYFDKAGRVARKGNLKPDGSFVKTDLTSIYIERAKAFRLFGRLQDAYHALAIARKNLSPELTRWQVNLLIEEAKIALAEEDITGCCSSLLQALPIVRAIQLCNREGPIRALLEKCKKQEPHNTTVIRLEKAFLSKVS